MVNKADVHLPTLDMCRFGMVSQDEHGIGLVKKPTRIMTNSTILQEQMSRRCEGGHRHVQLMSGRAAKAAEYPRKMVDAILDGMQIASIGKNMHINQNMNKEDVPRELHDRGEFETNILAQSNPLEDCKAAKIYVT